MSTNDERLAEMLADLTRDRDRQPDWDALGERHPELVDELRQLWTVAQMADAAGESPTLTQATAPAPKPATGAAPASFGDFEIVDEIGRGGMGVVYKAWEKSLKRFVALKMILRGEHASDDDLARFHREAQAAARLSHPNIVQVFQVGAESGQPYFSMKLVEGETLGQRVKNGPLPQREAARIIAEVADAVHHAHEHGILHRDLKPANILIDLEDRPLVTDFGLAKAVEGGQSITGTGAIVGTPNYMAPEQADGTLRSSQPTNDIYSLGAILYELLTGRPPFLAAGAMETLMLARHEEPVRPRLLNPSIDLDLEFICRKCLEKRPEHRYANAAALADDLRRYLHGEPVSARSSSMIYLVTRLFRESHHAPVLENWGVLWMWHSGMILLLCAVTSLMHAAGIRSHWPFLVLWSVGLAAWGSFFWHLRRRAGPVAFVERQIAHAWTAGVVASVGVFVVEVILGLPVLTLSPILPIIAGAVFLVKAGTLSGWFYVAAAASFATAVPMAIMSHYEPNWGPLWFGVVSAASFFIPGLKYYRQRLRNRTKQ